MKQKWYIPLSTECFVFKEKHNLALDWPDQRQNIGHEPFKGVSKIFILWYVEEEYVWDIILNSRISETFVK